MKSKKTLIAILILIATLLIGTIEVQAATAEIYTSNTTVEVGTDVTITAKFTAAAWNVKVSGNGISGASYASQTSDLSEAENVKTFKLDTSKAGTYKISISGDITDANGETKEINKSCTVTVNEKQVIPTPDPEPEPEPETPPAEEKPEFKNANKTMYAEKDINLRASWSTSSKATKVSKGTELTVTATSSNKVNDYVWYRVSYNGATLYVASNLLTDTKPEETEEPKQEEPKQEEPAEETPVEEPTTIDEKDDENEAKDGLKSLEIEGLTLSPTFSPDIYEYRAILKTDLSELTINAVPAVEGATITIAGNDNLQEGENLITIVVYNAKDEGEATYQIAANKSTLDLSDTDKILRAGTQGAKKEFIIYIAIFAVALVGLILVMILRNRIRDNENEYEEGNLEGEELTNNEQTVENTARKTPINEQVQDKVATEETRRPRSEKRKGKHF